MEALGNGEQFLPGLGVIDAQADLRVGRSQRLSQGDAAHTDGFLPLQNCSLRPDGKGNFQCAACTAAPQILGAEPALRRKLGVRWGVQLQRQGQFQYLFVAFQFGQTVFPKGRDRYPAGKRPMIFLKRQQRRAEGSKAGQDLCPGIRQRPRTGQGSGFVQCTGQRFRDKFPGRLLRLEFCGEGIRHTLQLVRPPGPQLKHQGSGQLTGGVALPFCDGKAHRLGHTETAAVLTEAVHVHHLIEAQGHALALQGGVPFGPPGTLDGQFALCHGLAVEDLQVPDGGVPADVQDCGGRRRKRKLPFHGHQLFQRCGPPHPGKGGELLLDAALGQGRDDIGAHLGVDRDHQPVGSPHLDAARVDSAAVEVFGLALHLHGPGRKNKLRQVEKLGEGQLLFGLAQARPLLALIVHGAPQIAF